MPEHLSGNGVVLAGDIGGTNMRFAAIDESGRVLAERSCAAPAGAADGLVELIGRELEHLLSYRPTAVGLGVAGVIRKSNGSIVRSPNLKVENMMLAGPLSKRLGLPVCLVNDADAALLGELWQGVGRRSDGGPGAGLSDAVMLTFGTGVGGAVINNGRLVTGADDSAAELGHICVDPDGPICSCGCPGCLEAYASGTALAAQARRIMAEENISRLSDIADGEVDGRAVTEAALAGDELALRVIDWAGRALAVVIADLMNIFDPQAFIFGGGAAPAAELMMSRCGEIARLRRIGSGPAPRILMAGLGDEAGRFGAARAAFDLEREEP